MTSRFRSSSSARSRAVFVFSALLGASLGLAQGKVDAAIDTKELRKEAQAAIAAGDFAKAAAGWQKITAANPKDGQAWQLLGYCLHASGKLDEALPIHVKAAEFPAVAAVAAYNVACVHALKGRPDDAFTWLDKAVGFGFDQPEQIAGDTDLDALRKDPRFEKVLAGVEAKAKAANERGGLQAYVQQVERRNSRIAWFGQQGSPAQVAIDYSPVPWQEQYETGLQAGKFLGKKWRLGADFWTRLDTWIDLEIAGVKVPAGYYYLTAEQRDANTFVLALHDPAVVKKHRVDGYFAAKLQGGLEIPLQHAAGKELQKQLEIEVATAAGSLDHGTLTIRFGSHELSAPMVMQLGK